jgi:nucleoporin NDC1
MWFSTEADQLGWIIKGDIRTPDRLNERPIYLRSVFLLLALCRTVIHLYYDYSSVHVPSSAPQSLPSPDHRTHKLAPTKVRIQAALPRMLKTCALASGIVAGTGPFIYTLLLRQVFWSWHLGFAKLVFNLSRSDAKPSGYPPCNPQVMLLSFLVSFILMFSWETTSCFFFNCLLQQPLKKDQPLSAGSKDPNGTLLTGLRSRRGLVKTFAFWELLIITQDHPERRKAIFADIGRDDGPVWSQMLDAALDVVRSIEGRIVTATTTTTNPIAAGGVMDSDPMEIDSLPCIAPPIRANPIFTDPLPPQTRTEDIGSLIGWGAKRIGQSREPYSSPLFRVSGSLKYLTPSGAFPEKLDSGGSKSFFRIMLDKSALSWFFSTTFERKANAVIIGSPYSNAAVQVDAIESISRMLVASLSEDIFGKAIAGVSPTVRTFTTVIIAIESYVQQIKEQPDPETDIDEIETVLACLKASLAQLLSAFQLYLTDQGLSAAEHRQAQNASRPGRLLPERAERKKQAAERQDKKTRSKPNDDVRKGDARSAIDKGDNARDRERDRNVGGTKVQGERPRSQKRLEPQDPARKKLFQDIAPKRNADKTATAKADARPGRRMEMEMAR